MVKERNSCSCDELWFKLVCLSTPPVFSIFLPPPLPSWFLNLKKKGLHGELHTFKNNTKQNVWGQGKPSQMNKPCGTVLTKQGLPHQCSWIQLSREMPSSGKFQTQQVSNRKSKSWSTSEFHINVPGQEQRPPYMGRASASRGWVGFQKSIPEQTLPSSLGLPRRLSIQYLSTL